MSAPEKPPPTPAGLAALAAEELATGDYRTATAYALVSIAGTLADSPPSGCGFVVPAPPGPSELENAAAVVRGLLYERFLNAIESWPNRAWLGAGSLDLASELAEHIARECTADAR